MNNQQTHTRTGVPQPRCAPHGHGSLAGKNTTLEVSILPCLLRHVQTFHSTLKRQGLAAPHCASNTKRPPFLPRPPHTHTHKPKVTLKPHRHPLWFSSHSHCGRQQRSRGMLSLWQSAARQWKRNMGGLYRGFSHTPKRRWQKQATVHTIVPPTGAVRQRGDRAHPHVTRDDHVLLVVEVQELKGDECARRCQVDLEHLGTWCVVVGADAPQHQACGTRRRTWPCSAPRRGPQSRPTASCRAPGAPPWRCAC